MTEQEAMEIKRVISYIRSCREAGIDTTITIDKNRNHFILNALEEIRQYRALGTVEELREAMEKQRAKKPKFYAYNFYCSKCGNLVGNKEFGWQRFMYCDHCGQSIDWSEEK